METVKIIFDVLCAIMTVCSAFKFVKAGSNMAETTKQGFLMLTFLILYKL